MGLAVAVPSAAGAGNQNTPGTVVALPGGSQHDTPCENSAGCGT